MVTYSTPPLTDESNNLDTAKYTTAMLDLSNLSQSLTGTYGSTCYGCRFIDAVLGDDNVLTVRLSQAPIGGEMDQYSFTLVP